MEFDANGRFVSATNQQFSLSRSNGAVTPLTVNMNFDTGTDAITALTRMAEYGIDLAEQPVAIDDFKGLKLVTESVPVTV
ncbi:MAG: hypothetical protein ACE5I4_08385, partial [Thermoplasmata archaeon]